MIQIITMTLQCLIEVRSFLISKYRRILWDFGVNSKNHLSWLGFEWVRNRDEKGRFVADDKSTPDVDESKKRVYKSRKVKK